jgi:hypothetical protein
MSFKIGTTNALYKNENNVDLKLTYLPRHLTTILRTLRAILTTLSY